MNLFRLSASYIRQSGLATALNLLLLILGVGTISLLLILGHELESRLTRDAQGIDLVVGAKGSPLQLILAGVFHVDTPTGNIPLDEALRLRNDPRVAQLIPISLGDSYSGFRIVGTEPELIAHYGAVLAAGRLWSAPFDAVIGEAQADRPVFDHRELRAAEEKTRLHPAVVARMPRAEETRAGALLDEDLGVAEVLDRCGVVEAERVRARPGGEAVEE